MSPSSVFFSFPPPGALPFSVFFFFFFLQVALLVSTANTFSFQFDHLTINDYIFSKYNFKINQKNQFIIRKPGEDENRCPIECGRWSTSV